MLAQPASLPSSSSSYNKSDDAYQYKNLELGVLASKKMLELEAANHGAYVLLSNIYADLDDWDNADTSPVMFDIDEEEKEDALCLHSEKAAIAFGIMSLKEDVPIRIVKNLRVCGDCHQVSMMISKIFDREIIVRDRNLFHHFKDGHCSCNGFW